MGKFLKLCVLFILCGLAFGCANKQQQPDETMQVERFRRSYEAALDKDEKNPSILRVLRRAKSAIGTPYVRGGINPGGFDCSGFVCWTYKSVGVDLPRTAREQSQVGRPIRNTEEMQAGDIVAFRHPRRGYHTGIYVGEGKFIHSPRRRTSVRINSLSDPYFSQTFLGARRVSTEGGVTVVAEAENRLDAYAEEKFARELVVAQERRSQKRPTASRQRERKKTIQSSTIADDGKRNNSKATTVALLKNDAGAKKPAGKSSGSIGKSSSKPTAKASAKSTGKPSAASKATATSNKKSATASKSSVAKEKKSTTTASKSKSEAKSGSAKSSGSSSRSNAKSTKAGSSNKRSSKS